MTKYFLLIFLAAASFIASSAPAVPPQNITGNWINIKTSDWEYGFFEHFAIYEEAFWKYESVQQNKKTIDLILKKDDGKKVTLKVTLVSDSQISISKDGEKAIRYKLNHAGFSPYPKEDHTVFPANVYTNDTVTITGYYHDLYKTANRAPFSLQIKDVIADKSLDYYADFDSLGRFQIKFPVHFRQEVYMDWGRSFLNPVVSPGEHIFLFVDALSLVTPQTQQELFEYMRGPKNILYMGQHARLHNEMVQYPLFTLFFDRMETAKGSSSDMNYLMKAEAAYNNRMSHLNDYIKKYPTLSDRFKEFEALKEKQELAHNLMQYRFNKREKHEVAIDPAYLQYVEEHFNPNKPALPAVITREWISFIIDHLEYHQDLNDSLRYIEGEGWKSNGVSMDVYSALIDMQKQGLLTQEQTQVISGYNALMEQLKAIPVEDSVTISKKIKESHSIYESFNTLMGDANVKDYISTQLNAQLAAKGIANIEAVIQYKLLRELSIAKNFYSKIEQQRQPFNEADWAMINSKIENPHILDYLTKVSEFYTALNNKTLSYEASLINTSHLKESKDADLLFKQLLEPYRGKVIYLDFWGTWCGPCREQMHYVGALKKALADKDVVFMYFANNSPQKAWENMIKEMDLTGRNIVHYRLPDEQQNMLERRLMVNAFPTFMLVDREGRIVNTNAPRPDRPDDVVRAVDALLR